MRAFNRIALVGAGSLGLVLGAYISKSGRQIDLIDSDQAHVDALNLNGARIIGTSEFTVPVHGITPEQMEGSYDLILYLVKQTADEIALPQIAEHMHEKSILCTLQNGLPEPGLVERFGLERVMGATVGWGATLVGPGVSQVTSTEPTRHFVLGRPDGVIDDLVYRVRAVLEQMCRTEITNNLMGIRWCKLGINALFSGLSAGLGSTYGVIMENDRFLGYAAAMGKELADVARANGVTLAVDAGMDFAGELYYEDEAELPRVLARYRRLLDGQQQLEASMLQDIRKGRRCEVDAINGMVSYYGKRAGIPTPKTDALIRLIKEAEAGVRVPSPENFALLPGD